jgi:hypothetical protein
MAQTSLNSTGVASSGSLVLQSNGTTTAVTIDTSQNMGLGVTPSAWSGFKALQIGTGGALANPNSLTRVDLTTNAYYNGSQDTYIGTGAATSYRQNGGQHIWYYAASGSAGGAISYNEAMRTDTSGRLLVGATTDYGFGGKILTRGGGVVSSSSTWDNNTTGGAIAMFCDNANYGTIWALKNGNSAWGDVAIAPSGGNLLVGTTGASPLNTGRVRALNPSGSSQDVFKAYQANSGSSCYWARIDNTSGYLAFWDYAGSGVGSISTNGTITVYNTTSDHRLKNNQAPLTGSGEFIDSLKPKTWTWVQDGSKGVGFIAHEFFEVSPSSVNGEKDAVDANGKPVYQAMQASSAEVIANLVAEIQSLRQRLEAAGI